MVSVFTPNINLEEPARGDDVGTWDTPVNNNTTEIDLCVGGIATISAAAGSVTLSAAQLQSRMLTFNSTLLANITITFKTSFIKDYLVQHLATGSSAFTISLATTAASGQAIAIPPGEATQVYCDGTNLKFMNLGRIGSFWDYGGSSVPNWVSTCTVPPYLNCDASAFSSATYPQLTVILGGTTLPDSRGRVRASLNQGTGRITAAGGVDGNTNLAGGGAETITLTANSIPSITSAGNNTITVSVSGNNFPFTGGTISNTGNAFGSINNPGTSLTWASANSMSGVNAISVVSNNTGNQAHPNMQPTYVGGLQLIRAA